MRSAEFRRIVESLRVAIAMTDAAGVITFANVNFAQMSGHDDDRDLVGIALAELFAADDRKRVTQNVERIAAGKAGSAIFEGRVAGGAEERWVQAAMQPALDARDQPGGALVVLHDIGAQRDTEQALFVLTARLLALAEASPVAAMIEGADGDVEMVNEAFIRLLGLDAAPQSLMGLPADDVLKRSKAVDAKALEKARAKKRGIPILELKPAEGAPVMLERQPIVVEGEVSGGVWSPKSETTSETSAKGAAEIALIERIGEELSIAMDGITAISMRARQMEFEQDLVDDFMRMRRATENAMAAIGDLIDFSNVSGNIVLRKGEFGLRAALSNLIGRILIEAEEHDCRFRLKVEQDVSDQLEGDVERLELVLKNLLESAFALLPGAEVTLQITPEYITDSGIQISFGIVYSDEGTTKPTSMAGADSGMRVAVARFMVTAMGGKLAVAAHPSVGDALYAFTIEFPVRPMPASLPRASYVTLVGMRVLVVSGNAQQRLALSERLRGWRMQPLEADNAPVALALLERFQADGDPVPLVILSNRLSGQDGFLLAFRIKQHPKLRSTLVMLLATEGKPGDAIACRENGIAAYMRYPVGDQQLNDAIHAVTGATAEIDADTTATLITRHSLREQRKGATVLLVDPSRDSQLLAAHFLGREDCSVVVANDLEEALSALDQDVYDLVLVDPSLQGLEGEDAALILRARMGADAEHTRIIAISANHSGAFDKAKAAIGFNGTLAKPFRKEDLLALLESVTRVEVEA